MVNCIPGTVCVNEARRHRSARSLIADDADDGDDGDDADASPPLRG